MSSSTPSTPPGTPSNAPTVPSGCYALRGRVRPRRNGYLADGEPVKCADGHKIWSNTTLVQGAAVQWCSHRADSDASPCNLPVYVDEQRTGTYIIDVNEVEGRAIQSEHLSPAQVRRYLDIGLRDTRQSA